MNLKSSSQPIHEIPDGTYMSCAQLEFFRLRLQDERRRLLESAQSTLEQMRAIARGADSNDRASTEEKLSLEFRIRDRERKLLKKIDDALVRIGAGTYGWCAETGEPIGMPRLLARPTATLCIEAQERHESNKRAYEL